MKKYFKVVLSVAALSLLGITISLMHQPALSKEQALRMIYGNYDSKSQSASWVNIPFPDKEDASSYFEKKKGIVRMIALQAYRENGKDKFFILTKTIPTDIPFDCHACLPLIGAAVFVRKHMHWKIEAQNQFIMYDGEYGELPEVKLIRVGKDKFGLSLEFGHIVIRDKELTLLIPYNGNIVAAHNEVIYFENFNDCEYAKTIPCAAYTANIDFASSKNPYYTLQIKRFGTVYNHKREKAMPVDEEVEYQFVNGQYVQAGQRGAAKALYDDEREYFEQYERSMHD
ncbi:MAG: hypothetical protein ACD_46C00154G0002 [uncultured bacterium]|nr:MAG: hypothetical protein ACD_46C00154G0002 [uncultured bacterium]